jgi:hypothetical protein
VGVDGNSCSAAVVDRRAASQCVAAREFDISFMFGWLE